jgi:hypothetical protein
MERKGSYLLERRRPPISSRPQESNAIAPVARLGSISGVRDANAGAENALRTSANPKPAETLEIQFRALNFII